MNTEPRDEAASDGELIAFVRQLAGEALRIDERAFAVVLYAWMAARYAGREREPCEHIRPWVQVLGDEASGWLEADAERN
jgi:hypothetical protein